MKQLTFRGRNLWKQLLQMTFVWIIIFSTNPSMGQNDDPLVHNVISKGNVVSPDAASLGKYGEFPVNNYTGLPSISIPLYSVQSGEIGLPISINYHAGGIKVEEMASWVGLGWSLNAGGVITRSVRGIADDIIPSSARNYRENNHYLNDPEQSKDDQSELMRKATSGYEDTEPDIYYFNFGGRSGKFYLDEDPELGDGVLKPVLIPKQSLRIQYERGSVNNQNRFRQWIITTEDGTKYYFGYADDREVIETNFPESVCSTNGSAYSSAPGDVLHADSWYLVKIQSRNGREVNFYYDEYNFSYRTFGSESYYYPPPTPHPNDPANICGAEYQECYVRNNLKAQKLNRITFDAGSVHFITEKDDSGQEIFRSDLCQDQALQYVDIRDIYGNTVKTFRMDYGYFKPHHSSAPAVFTEACFAPDEQSDYRLKLEQVVEIGTDGQEKEPHKFTYNTQQNLPSRLYWNGVEEDLQAYGQDHWGYYNAENNTDVNGTPTLIPSFINAATFNGETRYELVIRANRSSNETYAQANVLQRIDFPTGGFTEFDFESNRIASDQVPERYGEILDLTPRSAGFFHWESRPDSEPTEITNNGQYITINSDFVEEGRRGAYVVVNIHGHECGSNSQQPIDGSNNNGSDEPIDQVVVRDIYRLGEDEPIMKNPGNGAKKFFPNGQYYIRLYRNTEGNNTCTTNFNIKLSWDEVVMGSPDPVIADVTVGGLRIAKITSSANDHSPPIIKNFDYSRFSEPGISSGAIVTFPIYSRPLFYKSYIWEPTPSQKQPVVCYLNRRESTSQYQLAQTNGGVVGYKNLTITYGDENSQFGKEEYTYRNPEDYPDLAYYAAPADGQDWRRGQMSKQTTYKWEAGVQKKISETEVERFADVAPRESTNTRVVLVSVDLGTFKELGDVGNAQRSTGKTYAAAYKSSTGFLYTERQISSGLINEDISQELTTTTDYSYSEDHFQLTQMGVSQSDGSTLITKYIYPPDLANSLPANPSDTNGEAIAALLDRNMVASVIEKQVIRSEQNIEELIGGELLIYRLDEHDHVHPHESYALAVSPPSSDRRTVSYEPNVGLNFHGDYELYTTLEKFDSKGNPVEITNRGGVSTVLIWSYDQEHLVGKVDYASYDQVVGLESVLGLGFFNDLARETDHTTIDSMLSEMRYIIEANLPGTLLHTYTFRPGVGMESATGPNGISTTYRYDHLGRLERIIDHHGNVLKQYEYNYRNSSGQ